MPMVGLDHRVLNTRDVEQAVPFYRDVLGMEILRLDECREGKGGVSARLSPGIIIDIRPRIRVKTSHSNTVAARESYWTDNIALEAPMVAHTI